MIGVFFKMSLWVTLGSLLIVSGVIAISCLKLSSQSKTPGEQEWEDGVQTKFIEEYQNGKS